MKRKLCIGQRQLGHLKAGLKRGVPDSIMTRSTSCTTDNSSIAFFGTVPGFAGAGIKIPEGYLAIVMGNNIVFIDDAAVQVLGQVFQRRPAIADPLAVDDPSLRYRPR